MDLWNSVRQEWFNPSDGKRKSLSALGLQFKVDYRLIKKIIAHSTPPGYRLQQPRQYKKLGAHVDFIKQILHDDIALRPKQRHSAQRIYERLCKERGYEGSDRSVRELVSSLKQQHKEVFIPLAQPMSQAQVDFFEVDIYLEGKLTRVYVFSMVMSYSDSLFCMAFPFQKQEAWLEGHKQAFLFFGGIPRRIVYDNDKSLVAKILSGHERKVTDSFQQLQSFYCFMPHFCNSYSGNEKGIVENANKYAQQHLFTPYPIVSSFAELNTALLSGCADFLNTTAKGKEHTRRQLLEEERREFLELPAGEFEACMKGPCQSDSQSQVHFDTSRYSVPDHYANHEELQVKGFWDRVEIYTREGALLGVHIRKWQKNMESLDPLHYLTTLEKKPGALDHGRPFATLDLPTCFQTLRQRLESEAELEAKRDKSSKRKGGAHRGTKRYVQILKLLKEFSLAALTQAVEKALSLGHPQYELIRQYCYPQECPEVSVFTLDGREHLQAYDVKKPQLSQYEELIKDTNQEEMYHCGQAASVVGALPEGVEVAGDAPGLFECGRGVCTEEDGLPRISEVTVRAGTVGAGGESWRTQTEGSKVSCIEDAGEFRFPTATGSQRAADTRADPGRVCKEAGKRDLAGGVGNGQDAPSNSAGICRVRPGREGAILEHGCTGDDVVGSAGSADVAEYAAAVGDVGPIDP